MVRNLEVNMGLLHYCTFGLEAADGGQNVGTGAVCKKLTTSRIYKNDNVLSQLITKSLQMSERQQ